MARLINMHTRALPDPDSLTEADEDRLVDLQRRKHLSHKDKDGNQRLSSAERKEMNDLEQRQRDRNEIRWGDVFIPRMEAFGQDGCAWELPAKYAIPLAERRFPGRLRVLAPSEPLPPGVSLRRVGHVPSASEQTFGVTNPYDLPDNPLSRATRQEVFTHASDNPEPGSWQTAKVDHAAADAEQASE